MTGHHEVRAFEFKGGTQALPSGWKPFAAYTHKFGVTILARLWVRDETEKKTQTEPSA